MFLKKFRYYALYSFVSIIIIFSTPQGAQASSILSFRLYGGGGFISGGDLNKGLEGYSGMYIDLARLFLYDISGGFKSANLGLEFGGDIIFNITKTIGISIGSSFIDASKESKITFENSWETLTLTLKPSYYATPINLGLLLTIPVSKKLNIILNGGAGYYLAKSKSFWELNSGLMTEELTMDVKGEGIGAFGGMSLELKMSKHFGLLIEFSGRYAKVNRFDGSSTEKINGQIFNTTNGRLYYFETQNWANGNYYPVIFIFDPNTPPINPPSLVNVHEANIDFSGYSMHVGFIIRI